MGPFEVEPDTVCKIASMSVLPTQDADGVRGEENYRDSDYCDDVRLLKHREISDDHQPHGAQSADRREQEVQRRAEHVPDLFGDAPHRASSFAAFRLI